MTTLDFKIKVKLYFLFLIIKKIFILIIHKKVYSVNSVQQLVEEFSYTGNTATVTFLDINEIWFHVISGDSDGKFRVWSFNSPYSGISGGSSADSSDAIRTVIYSTTDGFLITGSDDS
jgi:hypothetical protein